MLVILRVSRLSCANCECAKTTFVEQVPGLTTRYSLRTVTLDRVLCAVLNNHTSRTLLVRDRV
jgi:hypothetical protein